MLHPGTDYAVWFRGAEIGTVSFVPLDAADAFVGRLRPTAAYWTHRPALQTLTTGIADLHEPSPERIAATFDQAMKLIRAGGLELRTPGGGMLVTTDWLTVGDYAAAAVPAPTRDALPIIVHVRAARARVAERHFDEG